MTKAEVMAAALNEFLDVSWDVEAAAVVSPDGLPIASALPPDVEEDRLAAMSASLLTLGERAAQGLNKGALSQVLVEGETGYVALMSAGRNAVLVAVTSHEAKIGLVLFEMRRAAVDIAGALDGRPTDAVTQPAFEPAPPASAIPEDRTEAPQAPAGESADQEPQHSSTGDAEESLAPVNDEPPYPVPVWTAHAPSPEDSQQEWNAWRTNASQESPAEEKASADAWTKSGLEDEKDPAEAAPWAQDVSSSSWAQRADGSGPREPESSAPSGEETSDEAQPGAPVWRSEEEKSEEEPKTPIEWRTDAEESDERAAPTSTWT